MTDFSVAASPSPRLAELSVDARLRPPPRPPLGPLCWRLASRLAASRVRGRAPATAVDGDLPKLLRAHRVACTKASLDVRLHQRELYRRLLWAYEAIGERGRPAEVALRALHDRRPSLSGALAPSPTKRVEFELSLIHI